MQSSEEQIRCHGSQAALIMSSMPLPSRHSCEQNCGGAVGGQQKLIFPLGAAGSGRVRQCLDFRTCVHICTWRHIHHRHTSAMHSPTDGASILIEADD